MASPWLLPRVRAIWILPPASSASMTSRSTEEVIRLDVYYVQGGGERKLEPIYLQLPDDTRDGVADEARSSSQLEVR